MQSPITRTMSKAPSGYRFEHKADIAGRHLILVDDVLTSGATIGVCARAFLRAGTVLVFARVVAPARTPI
jgi:predicted amidophosphoribosyltransferase